MKYNTSLRICDIKEQFNFFAPIKIFINDMLVWDDESYKAEEYKIAMKDYDEIMAREDYVISVTFDIVAFHHSYVYIEIL